MGHIKTLIEYYIANKQTDTDWVVIPSTNFDAYFGNNTFSKKIKSAIPKEILVQDISNHGIVRYKVNPEYLPRNFT